VRRRGSYPGVQNNLPNELQKVIRINNALKKQNAELIAKNAKLEAQHKKDRACIKAFMDMIDRVIDFGKPFIGTKLPELS
jgi:hypothetical protein